MHVLMVKVNPGSGQIGTMCSGQVGTMIRPTQVLVLHVDLCIKNDYNTHRSFSYKDSIRFIFVNCRYKSSSLIYLSLRYGMI